MFDDSIFTEYNDQNLSCMSSKMTKKWRKKWEKEDLRKRTFGAETIDRLVAKQESLKQEELEQSQTTVTPLKDVSAEYFFQCGQLFLSIFLR